MRERTIDVGGTELCVAEAGTGCRPFLLLHGFTGVDMSALTADLEWHSQ